MPDYHPRLVDKIGDIGQKAGFSRTKAAPPSLKISDVYREFPADRSKSYDVRNVLKAILDEGKITEYKAGYGKTIFCGYGRIDGWSVGIVANQRNIVKTKKGEMQFGGVIYSDSADKASRFIMNCNQKIFHLYFYKMLPVLW